MTDPQFDKHLAFSIAFSSLQDFQIIEGQTWIRLINVEQSDPERPSRNGKPRAENQKWGLLQEGLRDNHRCLTEMENLPVRGESGTRKNKV